MAKNVTTNHTYVKPYDSTKFSTFSCLSNTVLFLTFFHLLFNPTILLKIITSDKKDFRAITHLYFKKSL